MFNWCQNVFLISLLVSAFQRSVWSVTSISVLSYPWLKSSVFFHNSARIPESLLLFSGHQSWKVGDIDFYLQNSKKNLTSLTRGVTGWWIGWAIAHTGIGRKEGALLLANPDLDIYLRPCLQNVQKLVISCLSNESDTKPNYYDTPCIFVLLWFELGLDGECLVSVMLFTSVLIEICHQDGACMVLYK